MGVKAIKVQAATLDEARIELQRRLACMGCPAEPSDLAKFGVSKATALETGGREYRFELISGVTYESS